MRRILMSVVVAGAVLAAVPLQAQSLPPMAGFADLVEKYAPAVVNISTERKEPEEGLQGRPPFDGQQFEGTPFEEFFRDFFESFPMQQMPTQSLGSGVVISADGYVVTNNHVIENADDIIVRFNDNKEYKATLVGRDTKNDVALLKITADRPLVAASFADSDTVRVGDWVIAIGNPFGLGGSVSAGIVSARGRHIGQGPYDDFFQTDAAINPGNSGGPLFNTKGEIVGINTAILTRSGGSQGIGFAVPANIVKGIVAQLKEHGRPIRGWLGVRIQTVTPELAEALNMKENDGALVAGVVPGSPAAKAGIKEGDLILTYDGKAIGKMVELPRLVADTTVNKTVKVELMRGGKRTTLPVTIDEMKEDDDTAPPSTPGVQGGTDLLGMSLTPLTDTLRDQLGLGAEVKGLVVASVSPRGVAAKAGLQRGDVVTQINQQPVATVADASKIVESGKGSALLFLVNRGGNNVFVAVKP